MAKCTILGSGGSNGVPQVACHCYVCKSNDPKNKRTRVSLLLESDSAVILVDTSPDLYAQALRHKLETIDAVLYTHAHFDHIAGIDDIRQLTLGRRPIPAFMDAKTSKKMTALYDYIFNHINPEYQPLMHPVVFCGNFQFRDIMIQPFWQKHGYYFSYGFRFGDLAYSTDINIMNENGFDVLKGVKIWIVDCMRYFHAPTHSYLENTIQWIERVKPELAILTHMNHEIDYSELAKILPKNIVPGYDGLIVNFETQTIR